MKKKKKIPTTSTNPILKTLRIRMGFTNLNRRLGSGEILRGKVGKTPGGLAINSARAEGRQTEAVLAAVTVGHD